MANRVLRNLTPKAAKIRNKYYIASDRVFTSDWAHPTEAAAIAHGESILDDEPHKEFVAVVKIIKIVRRPRRPYTVERVV